MSIICYCRLFAFIVWKYLMHMQKEVSDQLVKPTSQCNDILVLLEATEPGLMHMTKNNQSSGIH